MTLDLIEMRAEHLPVLVTLLDSAAYYPINTLDALRFGTVEDPTCLPGLCLLATDRERVLGFCLACVREELGIIKLFAVAPPYRRQGIATALFDEIERRLVEQGVATLAVEGVAPRWFFPGVELVHTEAIAFLLQRGYETDRSARVDMRVDLAGADLDTDREERSLARQGLILKRATLNEIEPTAEFAGENFSEAWRHEVRDSSRFSEPPLHIALDGDRVIGFAAYDVAGPGRFGPTGTHPDYLRRGIGSALMKASLRDMRDRGDTMAEICWVGPIGYYTRSVGARLHRAYWRFRKPAT